MSENSCHFVNLLSLANNYFFSQFEINYVIQQPKTRENVDHLGEHFQATAI